MNAAAGPGALDASERTRDLLCLGLVWLAWAALALTSRQWLFLVPLGVALLLWPLLARRLPPFDPGIVGYALLVLPIAGLYQTYLVQGVGGNRFRISFYAALFFVLFAVVKLYARRDPTRLPRIVLVSTLALTLTAAGIPSWVGQVPEWQLPLLAAVGIETPPPEVAYKGLCIAFGTLLFLALRLGLPRPPRPVDAPPARQRALFAGVIGAVLATLALTVGGIVWVRINYHKMSAAFVRLVSGIKLHSDGGFSGRAQLGSVVRLHGGRGRRIAIRAFSRSQPGYLRGQVFLHYDAAGSRWEVPRGNSTRLELPDGRVQLPSRPEPREDDAPSLRIHPATAYDAHFFFPLETSALDTPCDAVHLAVGGIVQSRSSPTSKGYGVYLSSEPNRAGLQRAEFLQVPEDPELRAALDELLARLGLPDPRRDPIAVLAGHFAKSYRYQLGIDLDPKRDAVTQFLREKQHGHCELFASAGTLLLRRLGIPARYVTGFICAEKNAFGDDLWIARNRYAHAWIEYAAPGQGWTLAEFTPPAGLPAAQPAAGFEAFQEWLAGLWARLSSGFRALPGVVLEAVKALGLWLLGAWWRLGLLLAIVGVYLWRRLRGARRGEIEARGPRAFGPELAALRARYLELEARLEQAGRGRGGTETLLEYAARLDGDARPWPEALERGEGLALIRRFAAVRYAREGPGTAPS